VVKATCKEILDIDVHEDESTERKVAKLNLGVKEQKDEISTVQFKY